MIDYANNKIGAAEREMETTYPASSMSDGERVALYLIGHMLLAAPDRTVVVDEPEIHLHEALQSALWDALELARPDLSIVYITHDLDFAATRMRAPKVVMRSYARPTAAPQHWDWDVLDPVATLPEAVVLRIAGSRRPTLFVEGVRGGIDHDIYSGLYPDHHIEPAGSCEAVIAAVTAFRRTPSLHRYKVFGIIDGDDREGEERAALARASVYVSPLACIANLLVVPEALAVVGQALRYTDEDIARRTTEASRRVASHLARRRDTVVATRARATTIRRLGTFNVTGNGMQDLINDVQAVASEDSLREQYARAAATIDDALTAGRYEDLLRLDRNKGLVAEVAAAFGVQLSTFHGLFRRSLRANTALRVALRSRLQRGGVRLVNE